MAAVLMRMCDEDRELYGGPEWVRFDPEDLDDIPWETQYEWENGGLDMSIEYLFLVDWPARTARGKAAVMWLARTMAGIPTPNIHDFKIKTSRARFTIREEEPGAADAVPPIDAGRESSADAP